MTSWKQVRVCLEHEDAAACAQGAERRVRVPGELLRFQSLPMQVRPLCLWV